MARFELSLSPTYVKDWTYVEAVREIFQNAIDQETVNPDNSMFYEYDKETQTLTVSSRRSVLDRSTLLLGNTTKGGVDNMIGSFGEGYKLALLVLTRDNFPVTIHNYSHKETWVPKIINSRRYNSEVLVIDIHKQIFKSVPDYDLTFIIGNISEDQYGNIVNSNLNLQLIDDDNQCKSSRGTVLFDEKYRGHIYVSGLFVEKFDNEKMAYGYNMTASQVKLDRDRKAVDQFHMYWETSALWMEIAKKYPDRVKDMFITSSLDIQYIENLRGHTGGDAVYDIAYTMLKDKYGKDVLPVSSQSELEQLKAEYPGTKIVVVSRDIAYAARRSSSYINYTRGLTAVKAKQPHEIIGEFIDKHGVNLDGDAINDIEEIHKLSIEWSL